MKWKVRYTTYSRHGEGGNIVEVVEGENEVECMNSILELVGKEVCSEMVQNGNGEWEWEVEEIDNIKDFKELVGNCDGDDKVIYVYDLTNKEFIYEE
jgi:hypothetical protein